MRRAILFICFALLTGCRPELAPRDEQRLGLDPSLIDAAVSPGDDFFAYANGAWLKDAKIPPERSYAGADLELDQANERHLLAILEDLADRPDAELNSEERKLRDLFLGFADEAAIERAGLAPAQGDLDRIAAGETHEDVARLIGEPELGLDGPFSWYISTDDENPDVYVVRFYQSGLGLPDREYYLSDDFAEEREEYRAYVAKVLELAGEADADARSGAILALETSLAAAHWPVEDTQDAELTYNPMALSELEALAPEFAWRAALDASGVPTQKAGAERIVIVDEKSAFPELARIFAETPVAVWRDYLLASYLTSFSDVLPKRFDEAAFDFYGRVLRGQESRLSRRERAAFFVDSTLGEPLGRLFVERHFSAAAKAEIDALVDNLERAYAQEFESLAWMAETTRAEALAKLRSITRKIGYPEVWRDYSALDVARGDIIGAVKSARIFEWRHQVGRIDEPVDRAEWYFAPQVNNAYYDQSLNEICFPAGILQPPYFDPNADDAVNYGSIGATIGHELSHAFDDQGSKYDAKGVLRDWWAAVDRAEYQARTEMLVQQFDAYEPLPGLHINGSLTLGENIADLAGLVAAHEAYLLSLGGQEAPVIDGLTGDQRFYLAYAQSWREIWREELTRELVTSDEHAPPAHRVNGIVRNDDGWYAAFDVQPGDALYLAPADRAHIW